MTTHSAGWHIPDFTLRPFAREMAWHYTPASNLEGIMQAGALLPRWGKIWFTTDDAASEPYRGWGVLGLIQHHVDSVEGRFLRFGYGGPDLLPASILSRSPSYLHHASNFRLAFRPIAIEEFSIIEASYDDGATWRRLHTNPKGWRATHPNNTEQQQCKN